MSKVKNACPFCGFKSTQVLTPEMSTGGHQVECTNCAARGPCGYRSPKDAVLAWDLGDGNYSRPFVIDLMHRESFD